MTAVLVGAATPASRAPAPADDPGTVIAHVGRLRKDTNCLMMTFRGEQYALYYKRWSAPIHVGEVFYEGSIEARPYRLTESSDPPTAGAEAAPPPPAAPAASGVASRR